MRKHHARAIPMYDRRRRRSGAPRHALVHQDCVNLYHGRSADCGFVFHLQRRMMQVPAATLAVHAGGSCIRKPQLKCRDYRHVVFLNRGHVGRTRASTAGVGGGKPSLPNPDKRVSKTLLHLGVGVTVSGLQIWSNWTSHQRI